MTWDHEITEAVEQYHALLAAERITVEVDTITAVMRLDGVLLEVVVDPRAMRRDDLATVLTDAIRAAEHEADGRRDALAHTVTYLGHPVLELVEQMVNDPAGAARRLAGEPEPRRRPWAS